MERLDSTINFDFGANSPDPSIGVDSFTIRWIGQVQPFYSQNYIFYTTSDDGSRLWVNGQQVVNSWIDQGATEHAGTPIALTASQKYPILMEYYEHGGGAVAKLSWSSPSQIKRIIPQTQLYPASRPVQPTLTRSPDGTQITISWSGTYTLESATDVTGPWTPIAGPPTSPYTITIDPGTPIMFFRLVSQ